MSLQQVVQGFQIGGTRRAGAKTLARNDGRSHLKRRDIAQGAMRHSPPDLTSTQPGLNPGLCATEFIAVVDDADGDRTSRDRTGKAPGNWERRAALQ